MWVPTELVQSHSQGCAEKGEKEQVSGASRWVSSRAWSERTSGDMANIADTRGACAFSWRHPRCEWSLRPMQRAHHANALGAEFTTVRPCLRKGHKNTFLLSQFHAALFYFGCTPRAEPPKPLPHHEVSEPRGGAWDPSSTSSPAPTHTPSILYPPCSPSLPQPASPHRFPELGSSLLIGL